MTTFPCKHHRCCFLSFPVSESLMRKSIIRQQGNWQTDNTDRISLYHNLTVPWEDKSCLTDIHTVQRTGLEGSITIQSRFSFIMVGGRKYQLIVFRNQKGTIKAFDKFYSWFPSFLDIFPDEECFLNFAFWFVICTITGAFVLSKFIKIKPHHL